MWALGENSIQKKDAAFDVIPYILSSFSRPRPVAASFPDGCPALAGSAPATGPAGIPVKPSAEKSSCIYPLCRPLLYHICYCFATLPTAQKVCLSQPNFSRNTAILEELVDFQALIRNKQNGLLRCVLHDVQPHSLHLPCYGPFKIECSRFFMLSAPIRELQQPVSPSGGQTGESPPYGPSGPLANFSGSPRLGRRLTAWRPADLPQNRAYRSVHGSSPVYATTDL